MTETSTRAASLVAVGRSGRHAFYRLHDHQVADLLNAIRSHFEHVHLAEQSSPHRGHVVRQAEVAHPHEDHAHGHGHSHGLVDPSIKRSRAGLRAVAISLGVLGATALAQAAKRLASATRRRSRRHTLRSSRSSG